MQHQVFDFWYSVNLIFLNDWAFRVGKLKCSVSHAQSISLWLGAILGEIQKLPRKILLTFSTLVWKLSIFVENFRGFWKWSSRKFSNLTFKVLRVWSLFFKMLVTLSRAIFELNGVDYPYRHQQVKKWTCSVNSQNLCVKFSAKMVFVECYRLLEGRRYDFAEVIDLWLKVLSREI